MAGRRDEQSNDAGRGFVFPGNDGGAGGREVNITYSQSHRFLQRLFMAPLVLYQAKAGKTIERSRVYLTIGGSVGIVQGAS